MRIDNAALPSYFSRLLLLLAAFFSIPCQESAGQGPGKQGIVTTVGGVNYSGVVTEKSQVTKVVSRLTDVYLTKAATKKTDFEPVSASVEIYEFGEPDNATRKKGKINLVVKNFTMKVARDGTATVSLLDPKLGQVDFTAALTKLTPASIHWSGVEYTYEFSFPLNHHPFLVQLVADTADKSKPDSVLRAARFMRQSGNLDGATQILARLPKRNEERKAEQEAIQRATGLALLHEIRILEYRGAIAAAAKQINKAVRAVASDESDWLDALAEAGKTLPGAPRPDLPDRARLRLTELGKLNQDVMASLEKDEITALSQQWAATMAARKWTLEQFRECISLSRDVGTLMQNDSDAQLPALARRLEASKLPRSILLDIVRFAPKVMPQQREWHRVDYVEPVSRKKFHYYASIPANAGPLDQLPVLVCMHGMNTKADVMYSYWGRWAERHGYVIVSPEYIYGREFGFRYSEEEVHSVNGAITHALRTLPIDSSKVFLQGHSQGGHAAWEFGATLSGRLTGVVPLLGVSQHTGYLSNFRHTAIYAIDGSEDGGAPQFNRRSIYQLTKLAVDAIYVEYRDRAHETFYEEYDRVLAWARPRARVYHSKVDLRASRRSDFRRRWIRIVSSTKQLPSMNARSMPYASVRAEERDGQIRITTENVNRLSILTPVEWLDADRKLRVTVNRRALAAITPSLDWKYLLREAHRTGDRTLLYCGETMIAGR